MFRCVLAVLILSCLGFATAASADSDQSTYPSQLFKDKPALKSQYQALIKPATAEHGWLRNGGTETPVSHIRLDNKQYTVVARCKPHDCPSENLVALMSPNAKHAVGALVSNSGDEGMGPKVSRITWLGQPDNAQRRFIAAYLFR